MADVYVKIDDLKELVEDWRRRSDEVYAKSAKMSNVFEDCADELEAVLSDMTWSYRRSTAKE